MPFTIGPRSCIGRYFALLELQARRRAARGAALGAGMAGGGSALCPIPWCPAAAGLGLSWSNATSNVHTPAHVGTHPPAPQVLLAVVLLNVRFEPAPDMDLTSRVVFTITSTSGVKVVPHAA